MKIITYIIYMSYKINNTNIFLQESSYTIYRYGTAQRSMSVIYQNPSANKPMYVTIDLYYYGYSHPSVKCGSSSPPTTVVFSTDAINVPTFQTYIMPLTFVVPPLHYYSVSEGNYEYWVEYIV